MTITLHYPDSPAKLQELKSKMAAIHSDAILRYISNLSCPKEQKLVLINKLKGDIRDSEDSA